MMSRPRVAVVLIFLVGFIVGGGVSWGYFSRQRPPSRMAQPVRQGGYRYINPLLECEVSAETENVELQPFKYKLEQLVEKKKAEGTISHVSVYFRDLNNGPWFGIDERENFSPASLLKVPVMMSYLKQAEQDQELLSKQLAYTGEDENALQYFKPKETIIPKQAYPVEELLLRMIAYSDNNADKLLFYSIDAAALDRTYRDLGIDIPDVRKPEDFMNIKTYASFFRMLFNASYLSREMSEKALSWLAQSEFRDGLVAGVPAAVEVSHKFGERVRLDNTKQLHDCGIVYYPQRPYLLCVMTRGGDFSALISTIQDISALVYQEVDTQYQKK